MPFDTGLVRIYCMHPQTRGDSVSREICILRSYVCLALKGKFFANCRSFSQHFQADDFSGCFWVLVHVMIIAMYT